MYIPPSANGDAALDILHTATSRLQTQHPQALLLISGDFNHAPPSSTLPTFTQFITCHTRDNKTVDLFNTKDEYTVTPPPSLHWACQIIIWFISLPVYKPLVQRQLAVTRTVKRWSDETEEALKDCFESTEWEVLSDSHGVDIDSLTTCITDHIIFCVENTVPTRTIQCFPNNKPWINADIQALLKEKKRAFRSGNKEELKSAEGP